MDSDTEEFLAVTEYQCGKSARLVRLLQQHTDIPQICSAQGRLTGREA